MARSGSTGRAGKWSRFFSGLVIIVASAVLLIGGVLSFFLVGREGIRGDGMTTHSTYLVVVVFIVATAYVLLGAANLLVGWRLLRRTKVQPAEGGEGSIERAPTPLGRIFLVTWLSLALATILGTNFVVVRLFPRYTGLAFFQRWSGVAVDTLGPESFEGMKRTLTQDLGGRQAVEGVIRDLGLDRDLPHDQNGNVAPAGRKGLQELVADFQSRLRIDFRVQSTTIDLVSVEFTHEDPQIAAKVPNALVANYMNWAQRQVFDRLDNSTRFLSNQVARCEARLDELEQLKMDFAVKHAGMSLDDPEALQKRINAVTSDLEARRLQQIRASRELARLEGLVRSEGQPVGKATREATATEIEYERLRAYLRYLREELDNARVVKGYTELHSEVRVLRVNIERVEARVRELEAKLPAKPETVVVEKVAPLVKPEDIELALAAARSEMEVATLEVERLENRLKETDALMSDPAARRGYSELLSKTNDVRTEEARWKSRLYEVRLALAAEAAGRRTHLAAVQTAELPMNPDRPNLWLVLAVALGGGAAAAGILTWLVASWRRSVLMTVVYVLLVAGLLNAAGYLATWGSLPVGSPWQ